jgi:hypothetical protein
MKNYLILILAMFSIFVGCTNKQNNYTNLCDSVYVDTISTINDNIDSCAFCQVLLREIKSFINKNENCVVVSLFAEKMENECSIFMSTELWYDTRFIIGYQIIDETMVAYYYNYIDENMSYYDFITALDTKEKDELLNENGCLDAMIDKSKLRIDRPKDFLDENSEFAIYTDYEPIGRRYIIHSPDSLELVFEGYY